MTTVDLTTAAPPPESLLDALPRRATLNLPELRLVAERAGGAPLPFDVAEPAGAEGAPTLEHRLGSSRGTSEDQAYLDAVAALHDPVTTLSRRGLLVDEVVDGGLAGAVGLLATPAVALDLEVAVEDGHAKAWHRQSGDAVASLATCDGIVFELSWFPPAAWADELGRVCVLPEGLAPRESLVPAYAELPYELADAATEGVSTGRSDLLHELAGQYSGSVVDAVGRPFSDAETVQLLNALTVEAQGRLRVLVAEPGHPGATDSPVAGVRSWTLVADGWRTLRPLDGEDGTRVLLRSVTASDLAADLAPLLSEVTA